MPRWYEPPWGRRFKLPPPAGLDSPDAARVAGRWRVLGTLVSSPCAAWAGGSRVGADRSRQRARADRGGRRGLARRFAHGYGARARRAGNRGARGRHDVVRGQGDVSMSLSFSQIALLAVGFIVVVYVSKAIRIVQQAQTMVIERLGKYHKTLSSGLNSINPILDKPRPIDWHQVIVTPAGDSFGRHVRTDEIDLGQTVYVFPRQNVITKDNVVVEIDALIYSQITDPVRATYEIANLPDAIEKLTQTTLRNVIGEMELDHVLSSRDTINAKLREILDE